MKRTRKNSLLLVAYSLVLVHFLTFKLPGFLVLTIVGYFGILTILDTVITLLYTSLLLAGKKKLSEYRITSLEVETFVKFLKIESVFQVVGLGVLMSYFIFKSLAILAVTLICIQIGFLVQKLSVQAFDKVIIESFKNKLFKTS